MHRAFLILGTSIIKPPTMKSPKSLCILLLCFVWGTQLIGQKRYIPDSERFNAGVIIGLNTSQIDGDYFTGYDKNGLTGGLKGIVRLTPRLDFNMEFLYSKKGSSIFAGNFRGNQPLKDQTIDLTYVDVPFLLKWMLENKESSWHAEGGLVYSRLVNSGVEEVINDPDRQFSYQSILSEFEKDDLSWIAGLGYTHKSGVSIHGRFGFGISKFYKNTRFELNNPSSSLPAIDPVEFLRNYYLSFQVAYAVF